MDRIEHPVLSRSYTYDCPKCGEPMKKEPSCNAYVCETCSLFFVDSPLETLCGTVFDGTLEEAKKHYDHKYMKMEMDFFGFAEEQLKPLGVGYLPSGFWAWRESDSRFGTLTLPMKNWKGQISNVLGKHIGSDEKLDLSTAIHKMDAGAFGIYNIEAFWEKEVHVFTNPTDCVRALLSGIKNSACICGKFIIPAIWAPKKIHIYSVLPVDNFVTSVCNLSEIVVGA